MELEHHIKLPLWRFPARNRLKLIYGVMALSVWAVWGPELVHAQPANDLFANALLISGTNILIFGSNVGATSEAGEPLHAGVSVSGNRSVWWSWTAPFSGRATVSTAESAFDTLLGVYSGTSVSSLAEVASSDDYQGLWSQVSFVAPAAGQTYQIAVDGFSGASGTVQLQVQLVEAQQAANDQFANRIVVSGTNTSVTGNNLVATSEPGEPDHASVSDGASVWWSWTAPFSGMATITTAGSSFDTVLGVYRGATVAGLTEIASDDDDDDGTNRTSKVVFFAREGQVYEIAVDGYLDASSPTNSSGDIRLSFQLVPYENIRLSAQPGVNQLVLSWPATAVNSILESAPTPQGPVWTQWPAVPTLIDGLHTVQISPEGSNRFFRLRLSR